MLVDNVFYVAPDSSPLYKFESNRTITFMDILHLEDFGDMSVVWLQTQLF